jgi:superfamily I DNA/RNA helicase
LSQDRTNKEQISRPGKAADFVVILKGLVMVLDLSILNDDQRQAVLHGAGTTAAPLLVIAGAGSGKTSTLAHRVANLVAEGVDPSRILMLTFSRRAAEEMKRRVERILAKHLKGLSGARLEWAGTFHAIGARLLREYSYRIGLDPEFSILDREDAADLMNLVRHELGLSAKESRFPTKATCLAIYSRAVSRCHPGHRTVSFTRDSAQTQIQPLRIEGRLAAFAASKRAAWAEVRRPLNDIEATGYWRRQITSSS